MTHAARVLAMLQAKPCTAGDFVRETWMERDTFHSLACTYRGDISRLRKTLWPEQTIRYDRRAKLYFLEEIIEF